MICRSVDNDPQFGINKDYRLKDRLLLKIMLIL